LHGCVPERLALCCASTPPGSLVTTNPQTGKPLDPKSLRKHFALEIGIGAAEANFLVCRLFLATIQGAPPPPGTVAITDPRARTRFVILFAKARMGWRETGVDEHRGKPGGRMIYRVQRPRSSATNSGAARRCRRDLLQSSAPPTGYSPSSSGTPCRSALPARARPSSDSSHHGVRPENSGPAPPSSCTSGGT
jgi:hypothetical protein